MIGYFGLEQANSLLLENGRVGLSLQVAALVKLGWAQSGLEVRLKAAEQSELHWLVVLQMIAESLWLKENPGYLLYLQIIFVLYGNHQKKC